MKEEKIIYIAPSELKLNPNNPRKNDNAVSTVIKSIEKYGFKNPLIVDSNYVVYCGNTRLKAAKKMKLDKVPCIVADDLTPEQIREYALIDNKSNEIAEWDLDLLKTELGELDLDDFGLDWGIEEEPITVEEDEAPEIDEENEPVTKRGDIWQLGRHRLMCGDSTNKEEVEKLMNGVKADMVFTDPPYNVDYTDGQKNERKILNDHFETDEEAGEKLWSPAFENMRAVSNDCCSYYVCMPQGGTHMMMMMMMMKAGWQVKHEIIWEKQSIVLNRADYNYQHEPLLYGWNKSHKFFGKGKYHTTSIWKFDRPTKSKEHPTMKPVALINEALQNSSAQKAVVLDIFGGSGSTLIACEQANRICYTMELDEKYCDVIIKRWETLTGQRAVKL